MASPQYGAHSDDHGAGDDHSYETAPVAPRGAAPDNPYNGQLVPGHDYGASVPSGDELALTRQLRQGIDDVLADVAAERGLSTRQEGDQ
jgi:hypothetical protein